MHRSAPYLLILFAGIIWGSTFSLALIATADGAHPLTLTTWQIILTGAFLATICIFRKVPVFRLRHLHIYAILSVLGIIAPDLLYYSAAPHLSAGILSITISTVPMLTYAIMWSMKFEPFALKRALGIVLGMMAIVLLVVPDQGLDSGDASLWTLVVVLCALCYAIENVYLGEGINDEIHILELLCGSNLVATAVLTPITFGSGYGFDVAWIFSKAGWAITIIAFSSALAYMMFFTAIKRSGPVFASQCAYVVTISGVLWGILLFSETHTVWVWMSVLVMLGGLALVTPDDRLHASTTPLTPNEIP